MMRLLITCLFVALAPLAAASAAELPIFDAHIHYSQPAWDPYPPDAALGILDRGGVSRAMVSSTPDDGTLRLYEKAPRRIGGTRQTFVPTRRT